MAPLFPHKIKQLEQVNLKGKGLWVGSNIRHKKVKELLAKDIKFKQLKDSQLNQLAKHQLLMELNNINQHLLKKYVKLQHKKPKDPIYSSVLGNIERFEIL